MNRLTVGILLSFSVLLSVTALNYTPEPISDTSTCQFASGCQKSGPSCGKKAFGKRCNSNGNSTCNYKKQECSFGSKCQQSGSTCVKKKSCGPNCTKPCCAKKNGV